MGRDPNRCVVAASRRVDYADEHMAVRVANQDPTDIGIFQSVVDTVGRVLLGHADPIRIVLAAILAKGHVLLEDVPGVGKTTLARAFAQILGHSLARIQFTADMLPTDVLGVQVLDDSGGFHFRPGPIFSQIVLADEINRASPKTQSAMLQAMAEGQVTIDDTTHVLPQPFLVMATQNPLEHHGVYPLPESQLDRFAVSLSLGYPTGDHEKTLLQHPELSEASAVESLPTLFAHESLVSWQEKATLVNLSDPVAEYILRLVRATREHPDVVMGCSPRGAVILAALCRAWAMMAGRNFILPDDVKQLAVFVLSHRIVLGGITRQRRDAEAILQQILHQTEAPR